MTGSSQELCRIWKTPAALMDVQHGHITIDSDRAGGGYSIQIDVAQKIANLRLLEKVRLTNWLVEQRRTGQSQPMIGLEELQKALAFPLYRPQELLNRTIQFVVSNSRSVGDVLDFGYLQHAPPSVQKDLDERLNFALGWIGCQDQKEFEAILNLAAESKLLAKVRSPQPGLTSVMTTLDGYNLYEKLSAESAISSVAFVAMWFSKQLNEVYENGIEAGIRDAGYEPLRIDRKDHNNKIDDEIIAEIRRSKFVVADFTNEVLRTTDHPSLTGDTSVARGGVYFEAGFAKGLGKEVIWTVREDMIDFVHFDTRQYAHITWKDSSDLRTKLRNRISATLGDGPLKK